MTTVLSPQSRRPVLHRGYSCPSPRLPPAQYIAPSTPKWPAYVDDGNWQNAQAYNTFGDNYTSPPSGYGVGMNIMALALENQNMSWPADTGGFDSYLLAGWNGGSFVGSEAMSSGNNPQDATNLGFLNSGGADDSQSLSYAVAAMTAPSLMFASAATVFSEQSVLLEDARLNITVPQQNHNRITSQSPNLQDCSAHSASPMATFSPDCRSVQSNVKSSTKRKPGAVQKNRNWKVKSTKVKYSAGKVVGSEQVWVPDVRPSSTRTEEERQRIALNRLYGACPQHQEAHKPCNPSWIPYLRCVTSKTPIFYYTIDEIKLFRARPAVDHPLESKRTELYDLQNIHGIMHGSVPITLTQDLGHELVVYITQYVPRVDDKLNHIWYEDGKEREIQLPPYCLTYLEYVRANICQYINAAADQYLDDVINKSGPVVQAMLLQAVQFSRSTNSTMVRNALHILAINRMIERDWRVTGPGTFGLPQVRNEACSWYGKVPVTPMMDTTLDQIVIQDFLTPRRQRVLSELKEQMQGKRRQDCFEIILTVFILATNTEWLLRHSRRNALRYNRQHRYSSLDLAKDYFHGHNVLLSYFHYLAYSSFTSRRKQKNGVIVPSGSSLSPDQSSFLQHIQGLVSSQVAYTRHLRVEKRYEAELHWSHEIFLPDWEPGAVEIVNDFSA